MSDNDVWTYLMPGLGLALLALVSIPSVYLLLVRLKRLRKPAVTVTALGIRAGRKVARSAGAFVREAKDKASGQPPATAEQETPERSSPSSFSPGAGGIRGSVTRKSDRG